MVRIVKYFGIMRWNKVLALGLLLILSLFGKQSFSQERKRPEMLLSLEMGTKSGLSNNPKTITSDFETDLGVRFNKSIQLEIPLELGVKWERNGDKILSRNLSTGLALGYYVENSGIGPVAVKISACSSLLKDDFAGLELGACTQLFLDKSEQAFLSLGGGYFFNYGGRYSTWFIQAGIGIRLKR